MEPFFALKLQRFPSRVFPWLVPEQLSVPVAFGLNSAEWVTGNVLDVLFESKWIVQRRCD